MLQAFGNHQWLDLFLEISFEPDHVSQISPRVDIELTGYGMFVSGLIVGAVYKCKVSESLVAIARREEPDCQTDPTTKIHRQLSGNEIKYEDSRLCEVVDCCPFESFDDSDRHLTCDPKGPATLPGLPGWNRLPSAVSSRNEASDPTMPLSARITNQPESGQLFR